MSLQFFRTKSYLSNLLSATLLLSVALPAACFAAKADAGRTNPNDWKHFDPEKYSYSQVLVPNPKDLKKGNAQSGNQRYGGEVNFTNDPSKGNIIYGRGKKDLPTEIYASGYSPVNIGGKTFVAPRAGERQTIRINGKNCTLWGTSYYTPLADHSLAVNTCGIKPFNPEHVFFTDNSGYPSHIYGNPKEPCAIGGKAGCFPEPGKKVEMSYMGFDKQMHKVQLIGMQLNAIQPNHLAGACNTIQQQSVPQSIAGDAPVQSVQAAKPSTDAGMMKAATASTNAGMMQVAKASTNAGMMQVTKASTNAGMMQVAKASTNAGMIKPAAKLGLKNDGGASTSKGKRDAASAQREAATAQQEAATAQQEAATAQQEAATAQQEAALNPAIAQQEATTAKQESAESKQEAAIARQESETAKLEAEGRISRGQQKAINAKQEAETAQQEAATASQENAQSKQETAQSMQQAAQDPAGAKQDAATAKQEASTAKQEFATSHQEAETARLEAEGRISKREQQAITAKQKAEQKAENAKQETATGMR